MPSLINRITQLSRSSQGRGLMAQVQERLSSGGGKTKGRGRSAGRRASGRRAAGRTARGRRR